MKFFFKILLTLTTLFIGIAITCGGNILLLGNDFMSNIIKKMNTFFGFGSDLYLGPHVLWYIWYGEIFVCIGLSIWFFFWKFDTLSAKGKKIFAFVLGGTILFLMIAPYLIGLLEYFFL